ncbi:hypothetical protein [Kitasatospora sp. NPDC087271]|uniref:hypothetical protein n=1 Tax=Kitasatospora sp. NPDC087271 TaxID=3364067 RepID=UPI0037FFA7A9
MAQRRYEYAPAGTLPGLLQRGRGLGAQMAAEDPAAAADLVYGCIRWDWRWDRQVDDRHLYLARLVRDLELPVGPIVELLTGDEDTCLRATGVLELLALGGSAEARDALRTHVREGEHRVAVLESVAVVWPPQWWEDLAAGQDVRDGQDVRRRRGPRGPRGSTDPAPERDSASPPALLPEHGGGASDPSMATGELERQWAAQEWCGPMHTARGLARFGPDASGAASLLRRFWLWTPHSSERPAYLEALAAVAPAGLAEVYTECLWDCEADARLLAVAHAPDRPHVRERLAHLRDDPMEVPEVREAAGARLAGLSSGGSEREGAASEGELE